MFKVNKVFNLSNCFLVIWFIYHLQTYLFPIGKVISTILFLMQIGISFYCCFIANTQYKPPMLIRVLNILVCITLFYGLIRLITAEELVIRENWTYVHPMDFLRHYINSLLPVYVGYVVTMRKEFTTRSLLFWGGLFLLFAIVEYIGTYNQMLVSARGQEEFTNNMGYIVLAVIPTIVLVYKSKLLRYILLMVVFCFVISSMKRGAMLVGTVSLLYILWGDIKHAPKNTRWLALIIGGVLIFGLYSYVDHMLETSTRFSQRLIATIEGDTSNRDVLFQQSIDYLKTNMSWINFLFGLGADGVLKVSMNVAHNDWLEYLINMGVLGVIVLIIFFGTFLKTAITTRRREVRCALMLSFIYCFLRTFFSQSISSMPIYISFIIGVCLAINQIDSENESVTYN